MHSFCAAFFVASAFASAAEADETANPIRKIVTMLQQMQVEIEAEAEESKAMYAKFMCFCDSNIAQTTKEIEDGTELVGQLESEIKGLTGANAQIDSELTELESEMAENQKSVDEQAGVRKEEAAKFADESTETKNSIAAIDKALPALKKGVSFAQEKVLLGALAPLARGTIHEEEISTLLQATDATTASTGSSTDTIIGILEQMSENFKQNLKEMIQDEEEAIAKYNELISSKTLEISTAAKEKDSLKEQHAANAQAASSAKMELIKAQNALATNTDRLVDLKKNCADKTAEYDAATKGRQLELEAIGAAIKILNDDDALDLFKKTLPSPSLLQSKDAKDADPAASVWEAVSSPVSFVQRTVRPASFVQVAAKSKTAAKPDLQPVVQLVSKMHAQLGAAQDDDDSQRDFCKDSIAATEKTKEEKVGQVNLVSQFLKELSNEQSAIADQLKKLAAEIEAIELAVKEATLQREKEKKVFTKQTAEQNAAIAIIEKAKEVLGKAFGPESLVQKSTASKSDDTNMEGMLGMSFVQTKLEESAQDKELDNLLLRVGEDAGLVSGVKEKGDRGKQGAGIMAIMDEMKHDIELEVAELKHDEEESQADFDKLTSESGKATKDKKKEVTGREEAKAAVDEKIQIQTGVKGGYDDEVTALDEKLKALHEQCDFLLENYEKRKEARAQEMEGLSKSKAVLQGAKLDLAQTRNLRGQ